MSNVIDFHAYKEKKANQEIEELNQLNQHLGNIFREVTGKSLESQGVSIEHYSLDSDILKSERILEAIKFLEFAQHNLFEAKKFVESESLSSLIDSLYEQLDLGFIDEQ